MLPNISPQLAARLDLANRTIHILWLALMASVGAYGATLFMVERQNENMAVPFPLPSFVLPIVAVGIAVTGFTLYRQLSSPDRIRALLQEKRSPEQAWDQLPPAAKTSADREQLFALSEAELRLSRVPGLVFTCSILRWALFESIAILGLVLGIMHRSFEDFVPYGIAAVALMAMTPPKVRQVTLSAIPLLPSDANAPR